MFERIKNWFRKGGAAIGMIDTLQNITDHPKINVDSKDFDRIQKDLKYFAGQFPRQRIKNTYGDVFYRDYVSLNMLQVACRREASLLYNEQAKINITNKTISKFVTSVLENNDFNKNFEKYLESCLALGGLAAYPYFDPNTKQINLNWAQAPSIFPMQANTNNISNICIASVTTTTENKQTIYYTLLQFHEWNETKYTVTNELYRSEMSDSVGMRVPLSRLYPNMQDVVNMGNFSRSIVAYLRPAGFNNQNITSPLGLGIASNARSTLRQINDAYNQYHWEIVMGQRKVAVSQSTTTIRQSERNDTPPKQVFDANQNVFVAVPGDYDKPTIEDLTHDIRSQQYIDSINHFIKTLEMQLGLSVGTFSFDGAEGLKTATEVVSQNSMTYQTRNSQLTQIERFIQELSVSICELGKLYEIYNGPIPTLQDITVDFDDGIFTDKKQELDYWTEALSSKTVPKYVAIMRLFKLDENEAKAWVDEINDETADEALSQQPNGEDMNLNLVGDDDGGAEDNS